MALSYSAHKREIFGDTLHTQPPPDPNDPPTSFSLSCAPYGKRCRSHEERRDQFGYRTSGKYLRRAGSNRRGAL